MAWASAQGEFGVLWSDLYGDQNWWCDADNLPYYDCNYELYFQRIGPTGTLIGATNKITTNIAASRAPSLVWTGSEYGAAFTQDSGGSNEPTGDVYFCRIAGNGALITSAKVYNSPDDSCAYPSLAWNNLDFGLSWLESSSYNQKFMGINNQGNPSTLDLTLGLWGHSPPATIWDGSAFAVTWGNGATSSLIMTRIAGGSVLPGDTIINYSMLGAPAWTGSEYGIAYIASGYGQHADELMFLEVASDSSVLPPPLQVAGSNGLPQLVFSGSEFGLAWVDGRDGNAEIYFTRLAFSYDSDGDGLSDRTEASVGTDPHDWDTDGDGLADGFEQDHLACLDPLALDSTTADPDGDYADNLQEFHDQTNPCVFNDTDEDGMPDAWEDAHGCMDGSTPDAEADYDGDAISNLDEYLLGADPCNPDSDGDGMPDDYEMLYSTCGLDLVQYAPDWDHDMDGLVDLVEHDLGTSPCDPDSDDDLLRDDWEAAFACLDPLVADALADPDADSLTNIDERDLGTDPCVNNGGDLDGDGLSDQDEISLYGTDPYHPDSDGDGLSDGAEVNTAGTDPLDPDTDGDGVADGAEVAEGTDPNDPESFLAAGARLVNYQGRLTDSAGQPVDGSVPMTFSLFATLSGGTALWSESHAVTVEDGIYNLLLGGDTVIPEAAMAAPELYLEIAVNGESLAPRQRVASVLSAINSDRIEGRRLETGTRTLSVVPGAAQKTVHVSFERPFANTPRVVVMELDGLIGGQAFVRTRIYNVGNQGFDVEWRSLSGASGAGSASFGYYAVGE